MKATVIISILIALAIIGIAIGVTQKGSRLNDDVPINNVSIVDGIQIIELHAKGGYQPRTSIAKAGMPTILRINTKGTFDCSSAVRIPSMNISKTLPPSGVTDIDLGIQKEGILDGTCGMGMYPFEIKFQS